MSDKEAFLQPDNLICGICTKYLSVPPIFLRKQNSDGQGQINVCGRCQTKEDSDNVRNAAFEEVAKLIKFPCSCSSSCKELLNISQMAQHEVCCKYREIICLLCMSTHMLTEVKSHFHQYHRESMGMESGRGSLREIKVVGYIHGMLICKEEYAFLVYIKYLPKSNRVKIGILPDEMSIPQDYSFSITFSSTNVVHIYKNISVANLPTEMWNSISMPTMSISHITRDETSTLEIMVIDNRLNEDLVEAVAPLDHNSEAIMSSILSLLDCPVCMTAMKDIIFVCKLGHSICGNCKEKLRYCPECRASYSVTRNYKLEEISEKFKDFLI